MHLDVAPGSIIGGRYVVEAVLGRGGMSAVYLATDRMLHDKRFAIKLLAAHLAADSRFVARFRSEADILADLNHPNILRLYNIGADEEAGLYYLVLEYLAGGTLKQRMDQPGGKPISVQACLQILSPVAEALDFAHARSRPVVHRDLKPSNIMFEGSRVIVSDFGLAEMLAGDPVQDSETVPDWPTISVAQVLGTVPYMAPEFAENIVTPASDLYSLGVVAYELVVGTLPFRAANQHVMLMQVLSGRVPPPRSLNPSISVEVERVLLKALTRDPAHRYATGKEFVEALAKTVERAPAPFIQPIAAGVGLAALAVLALAVLVWSGFIPLGRPAAAPIEPSLAPVATSTSAAAVAPTVAIATSAPSNTPAVAATATPVVVVVAKPGATNTPTVIPTVTPTPGPHIVAALPAPRYAHTATLLDDGRLLVVGGKDTSGAIIASALLYDPVTNAWTSAGAMSTPRYQHSATLLADGRVLVAGGHDKETSYLASAETFDPKTKAWSVVRPMSQTRAQQTAVRLADRSVLVAGGTSAAGFLASVERFDPDAGAWQMLAPMVDNRSGHSATVLDDNSVLVAGGFGSQSEDSAERYDPVKNTWMSAGKLNDSRISHAAVRLANGRVLVTGGNNSVGLGTVLSTAEWYDPSTNGWVRAASMRSARSGHTASVGGNGIVLVVGGDDPVGSATGAERYDPASNTWSDGGSVGHGRVRHTATALLDGSVVVLGGQTQGVPVPDAADYDPLTNRWAQ